jgi:large subunit ribosomal protein L25
VEKIVLKAELRSIKGKQVKSLRRQDKLPAVLYGRHTKPISVVFPLHEASLVLEKLQQSALVTIELGGESHLALIREKQRNYLTGGLLHVDFLVVSATEKIRTNVAVEIVGEAPAVRIMNGVLMVNLSEIEVEALPKNLPEVIKADVSNLAEIGSALHVRDLNLGSGVKVINDEDAIIAVVTQPESEVEEEAQGQAEPEVIEKGKKEEEEF